MKTGLVLEGGALRTIYSTGVMDAFLDRDLPMPDYTVGVSAGIAYGASYLSRQSRRNLKLAAAYVNDPRYMGWRNFADPKSRSYFGMDFVYSTIPNELIPFDYDALERYPGVAEAVVTNLETGQAEYPELPRHDLSNTVLRATCAIPLMFPAIEIEGKQYFDGGCADPIPWKRAVEQGCDRVVVVLTRERDYRKSGDSVKMLEWVFRKYPAFLDTMRAREERYNRCREELFERERAGEILVFAPDDTLGCSRTERNVDTLRALWQQGYFQALKREEEVRAFWS